MENINDATMPKIRRALMLSLLSEVEHKIKDKGKHYSPVSFTEAKYHGLVNSYDQKGNCEGKNQNVDEFHV